MSLVGPIDRGQAHEAASRAFALMQTLYPLCRSLTGAGVRRTLDVIAEQIPLERHEIPTGQPLFDWEVPREWAIRDAYVADASGRRLVDFRQHNLHVVNASAGVRTTMMLDELDAHLHSLPDHPQWIPYRTTYWRESWGFCLRHEDRVRLGPGPYEVVIDADLSPGHLTVAECIIAGQTDDIGVVYAHTCHPSLANDNLTGVAAAVMLADHLRAQKPRLTWHVVFGPGTLGSLAWLARHENDLSRVRAGVTLGLLGDSSPITYKLSRLGDKPIDRAAELVLRRSGYAHRFVDFEPYGYDERQFCSPGFDLPVGRLSRAQYGEYPEYHTSADDLTFVSRDRLAESIEVASQLLATLDTNRTLVNTQPKGEVRLGKRGLYGAIGGQTPRDSEKALLWVLSFADGSHDLVDIAARSGLPFAMIAVAAATLERENLLRPPAPANGRIPA